MLPPLVFIAPFGVALPDFFKFCALILFFGERGLADLLFGDLVTTIPSDDVGLIGAELGGDAVGDAVGELFECDETLLNIVSCDDDLGIVVVGSLVAILGAVVGVVVVAAVVVAVVSVVHVVVFDGITGIATVDASLVASPSMLSSSISGICPMTSE